MLVNIVGRGSAKLSLSNVFLKQNRTIKDCAFRNFENVAIIGCGIMGSGIAQAVAYSGKYSVSVLGENEKLLKSSYENIGKSLTRIISKEQKNEPKEIINDKVSSILNKITLHTDPKLALGNSDLIIEAISENVTLKQELYLKISPYLKSNVILATNTSSLSVTELSSVFKNKENFAGLHFFNPVPIMKLVEVVQASSTSMSTIEKLIKFSEDIKKVPIHCKDNPGFIVNRILVPLIVNACMLVDSNVATLKDVDTAMKLGASHPMGPMELADYIGLDTIKFILDGWSEKFPMEKDFKCPKSIEKLVSEGKLGRKTGEGFYKY